DAAGAESPRAELRPAVEPAHDLLFGQSLGDVLKELVLVRETPTDGPGIVEEGFDFNHGILRTYQAASLRIGQQGRARLLEELVPDEQCGAKRAAHVTGRGLNPEGFEGAFAQEFA